MAFIGMSFFLGWTFSAFFIPRLVDLKGRKLGFLLTMVMQTVSLIVMNFSVRVELTIAMMFVFGMACVGTRSVCFLYLLELLPEKQ
jgi:MFS family permease